jgi:DNA-binding GntR family transcriptional regulator
LKSQTRDRITAVAEFHVPTIIAKELVKALEDEIIFGELPPGMRIVEEEVVARFKVSRSPVREALRVLEQDGLVTRELRRGVRVSGISLADLDEVYSCRIPLEGLAAELAAKNRSEESLAAIRAAFAKMRKAFGADTLKDFFRCNVGLSEAVYQAGGSQTLKRLLGTISSQALRYRYMAYRHVPEMMQDSVEANSEIIEAIALQRPRDARRLTDDVIQRSWKRVRGIVSRLAEEANEHRMPQGA